MPRKSEKTTPRDVLEKAIYADPDDIAARMAYADILMEEGDPRGEFIQVQLALEEPGKSPSERKKLQKREKDLFRKHGREWLGELGPYLLDQRGIPDYFPERQGNRFQIARGWIDHLHCSLLNVEFSRVLSRSFQIQMLRRLFIHVANEPAGQYPSGKDIPKKAGEYPALHCLVSSPYLANVRILQLGDNDGGNFWRDWEAVVPLIQKMPRLEELHLSDGLENSSDLFGLKTLQSLRIMRIQGGTDYALESLAKNSSLKELHHLLLRPNCLSGAFDVLGLPFEGVRSLLRSPNLKSVRHLHLHYCQDAKALCREIVRSGILRRLKFLGISNGGITDDDAAVLSKCSDLTDLEMLDLSGNHLTYIGIDALRKTGIQLNVEHQVEAGEEGEGEFDEIME